LQTTNNRQKSYKLLLRVGLRAGVLALIDRNFQGFGKELFTDAGKYVIHFGQAPLEAAEQVRILSAANSSSD